MAQKNTNPLNYPRYVRGLRPALPESLPTYVEDEFEKLQNSMDGLAWEADHRIVSISATFESDIATLEARVETEEQVRADADSAAADRISTVEVAVDNHEGRIVTTESATATLEDEVDAAGNRIFTLELKRTVTLDNDGYAIGWEAVNAGVGTGTIVFRADTFAVGFPGSSTVFPFKIIGGVVYINEARIETASIGTLHLAGSAVTNDKLADGAVTNLKISGTLQSDNYVAGVSGWKIDKTGSTLAEFNGIVLSRDQVIDSDTVNFGYIDVVNHGAGFQELVDPVNFVPIEILYDTGIPVDSWYDNLGPIAATARISASPSVDGTFFADSKWAVSVDMLPVTRWAGAATVHLRFKLYGSYVEEFNPLQITWIVYKVT